MTILESKSPERTFMHDIASPVAVAIGLIDLVIDDSSSGGPAIPEAALKRLEKAQSALLQLQEMMSVRRRALMNGSR